MLGLREVEEDLVVTCGHPMGGEQRCVELPDDRGMALQVAPPRFERCAIKRRVRPCRHRDQQSS